MALSKAQIEVLRHASEYSVFEAGAEGKRLHAFLPYKGAAGAKVVKTLIARGLLNKLGHITLSGKGKLLTCPVATSESKA